MTWAILNKDQEAALLEMIRNENSDRIVAIIGGALLDDSIRKALEARLRPKGGNTDMNDKLFRVGGPLGFLGPRIDLGYQLYMLDKPHRNAMHGISDVRNIFAHNLSATFADQEKKMKDAFAKLVLHEGQTHYPSPISSLNRTIPIEQVTSLRDQFTVKLKLCLMWLMLDKMKHQLHSNIPIHYVESIPLLATKGTP